MVSSRRAKPTAAPAAPSSAAPDKDGPELRVLKKYPNRRLYDTQSSAYITLADVKRMVLEHQAFEVRDAKTGEDLTRSILLQIILEEESGGLPIFSSTMLGQIIRFYGHSLQGVMGSMLERNLKLLGEMQAVPPLTGWMGAVPEAAGLAQIQEQMQEQMKKNAEAMAAAWSGFAGGKR